MKMTPKSDIVIKILIAIIVFICALHMATAQDTVKATVIRVVDGDTFDAAFNSDTIRVRVLGLDTYETRLGSRLQKQSRRNNITMVQALDKGRKAKQYAQYLIENKTVLLHRGDTKQPEKDIYGRWLFYVEIGKHKFEQLMIEKGYDAQ